ncbi:P-loop containing nucleoside triphosphate hydrolase protein [Gamsiella multidivaricata]|uniref:P-loop containing nucleoside triphosphate hydrolase protein n=1 Tax=Gamsiella multidivaricata TaxID=101098 RepID=UPI0022209F7C|nr:P-loop containing nucleoside triphosphate hydrolase protein [Gamsiella multidivaricata]KAI7818634.1 P-loop containing nucleoside triphosphate hydrolase protein [Gamsiella multidivaricata]
MGKSAKFFKRPTRKEKAVMSLTKGTAETSLFDSSNSTTTGGQKGHSKTKDVLSVTANPTIAKKSTISSAGAHPPKASLAYKMQLNGGVKQAVKDLEILEDVELESEDEDMDEDHDTTTHQSSTGSGSKAAQANKKKNENLDKTKPRLDYPEASEINPANRPPQEWPAQGRVEFIDYETRYRPGLDLVLRGVNCSINPHEKIGICGRTGAGKSSLTLSLFRIIEAAKGQILVDGIDISTLGLYDVRSRFSIIPQDPVLFAGTIRFNLDPLGTRPDVDLWQALEDSYLKEYVSAMEGGLNAMVLEGGDNFSVGQRQLICLARALLRKTSLLVLDEATAAIDLETDALVQAIIRQKFRECTILTIAHRIDTVMDSDRIMVLDQGRVAEFDMPAALLADQSSIFYSLAKQSGNA